MRIIDLVLIAIVVLAGINGYRRGALLQLASYGGLLVGLISAGILVILLEPVISTWSTAWRGIAALVIFVGLLAAGETAGFAIGRRIKRHMRGRASGGIDRALGFPIAGAATLVLVWLLAGIFIASPIASTAPAVTYDIRQSKILRATSQIVPVADDALGPMRRFLGANRLPLPLPPFESPDAPPVVIDPAVAGSPAIGQAAASVFMVRGRACSQELEGSGWVVKEGYLVTNAHVVAGMSEPKVIQGPRALAATVTYFDSNLDLAVLMVPGLKASPLGLAAADPAPRTQGATIGFPGGGPQVVSAAAVKTTATSRTADIYGYPGVVRDLVFFAGDVKPGNSGGPLVDASGTVMGVVFASAAAGTDSDFALAPSAVRDPIVKGTSQRGAVSTGRCA